MTCEVLHKLGPLQLEDVDLQLGCSDAWTPKSDPLSCVSDNWGFASSSVVHEVKTQSAYPLFSEYVQSPRSLS